MRSKVSRFESPVVHHSFSHSGELVGFLRFCLKASGRFQFREGGGLLLSHYFSLLNNLLLSFGFGFSLNSSLGFLSRFLSCLHLASSLSLCLSFSTSMNFSFSLKDAPLSPSLLDSCLVRSDRCLHILLERGV